MEDMQYLRKSSEILAFIENYVNLNLNIKAITTIFNAQREISLRLRNNDFNRDDLITRDDIYNVIYKKMINKSQFDPLEPISVAKWAGKLELDSSLVFYSPMNETNQEPFQFAIITPWQLSMLRQFGDTVCLDATHGTNHRKCLFYSLVARNKLTGNGVPISNMLTSDHGQLPLVNWLTKLKNKYQFNPVTFVVDNSQVEIGAIKYVFGSEIHLLLCQFHVIQAWHRNARSKISGSVTQESKSLRERACK